MINANHNSQQHSWWLLWLAFIIDAVLSEDVLVDLQRSNNSHLRAMIIGMQVENFKGLSLAEPMSLSVSSEHWLEA